RESTKRAFPTVVLGWRKSMIDGPTPCEKEGHRLPRHPPCLDVPADLLGPERTASNGNRECVPEVLALLHACDAPHLPEPLSAEVGVVIDRHPVVLLAEELPDEVFSPSAGKQVLGVQQDALG